MIFISSLSCERNCDVEKGVVPSIFLFQSMNRIAFGYKLNKQLSAINMEFMQIATNCLQIDVFDLPIVNAFIYLWIAPLAESKSNIQII